MPKAAPTSARVQAQASFEVRTLLSNGEQLLVSIILPLVALIALVLLNPGALSAGGFEAVNRADAALLAVPGVFALAVVSTAFTGQAIVLAYERRYGVLRLLGTTPLGRGGLLVAKGCAVVVVVAVQCAVLGGVGLALGWRPELAGIPMAVVLILSGCAAFLALAALVGGVLRAEGVLALANLAWVLFLGCGLLFPLAALPSGVAQVLRFTPPGALGEGLRSALADGEASSIVSFVILVAWAAVIGAIASRALRWSD